MRSLLALLLTVPALAFAKPLKILTTLPELAEIAKNIGGAEVEAHSLLKGTEDPHFIDAVPSFIRQAADADGVCIVGLSLEIGWIPKILDKSANANVQPGGKGYCEAGPLVHVLDKPTGAIDRSMGDVHPEGNPHFYLSPLGLKEAAPALKDLLVRLRPEKTKEFEQGLKDFQKRMDVLYRRIDQKLSGVRKSGAAFIEYHKEFTYFFNTYKIKSIGSIEEKPGVPPSAARLAQIASSAKQAGVKLAIGAPQSPEKQLRKFQELSGIPYEKLADMVQVEDSKINTIEKLQDRLADALIKVK
jgi:zinc/manganese transport system substrate-binding protein